MILPMKQPERIRSLGWWYVAHFTNIGHFRPLHCPGSRNPPDCCATKPACHRCKDWSQRVPACSSLNSTVKLFACSMRAALFCRRLSTPAAAYCGQAFAPRRYSQYNTLSNFQRLNIVARCSGSKGTMKRPRGPEDPNVRVSKDMSRLLRHHPPPGAMDAAGWISLPLLLKHIRSKPTEEQVRQVVASCPKVGKAGVQESQGTRPHNTAISCQRQ